MCNVHDDDEPSIMKILSLFALNPIFRPHCKQNKSQHANKQTKKKKLQREERWEKFNSGARKKSHPKIIPGHCSNVFLKYTMHRREPLGELVVPVANSAANRAVVQMKRDKSTNPQIYPNCCSTSVNDIPRPIRYTIHLLISEVLTWPAWRW